MQNLKFRDLRADEIECRIARFIQTEKYCGISCLLYKNARADMAILDETVGPLGWQRRHTRENANCIVSIWDEEKKQWIEKEDVGTESNTEAEKGLASDSFKRACTNWGIGRELYTAPSILIPMTGKDGVVNFTVSSGRNGKEAPTVDLRVTFIKTKGKRIVGLNIENLRVRKTVFAWGDLTPEMEETGNA